MATVGLKYLVLDDNWPGDTDQHLGKPANGWDNTTDCCVTAPTYPLGTKIKAYDDQTASPGWYTMMYLARADGSFITDHTAAVGNKADYSIANMLCARQCGTTADGNTEAPYYYVTGDCTKSDATSSGSHAAFACGSMADADNTNDGFQCGWFWVGGVCPITDATYLDVSMTTSGSVDSLLPVRLIDATNGISIQGLLDGTSEQGRIGISSKTDA